MEIKEELTGSNVYVKTRRTLQNISIDAVAEEIEITYAEQKYYVEGGYDVIISTTNKTYPADFSAWVTGAVGIAIIGAVGVELVKETPGE
jgi:hypothetical protein